MTSTLSSNIHTGLKSPSKNGEFHFVKGNYFYYHYGCDGFDDRGWGCGYRTLMTVCSWIRNELQRSRNSTEIREVPKNSEIQRILVEIGDKEKNFIDSKQWIGTVEESMVLDHLYDVSCRIVHINSGKNLKAYSEKIRDHLKNYGSPIMMGGDVDNSSKAIVGICLGEENYVLIVDPHYWGPKVNNSTLQTQKWVYWKNLIDFQTSSYYNLCFPLLKSSLL